MLQGVAWSVPVIAAAVATPLAAATACQGGTRRETLTLAWNSGQYSRSSVTSGTGVVLNACGEVVTTVSVASSFASGVVPNPDAGAGNANDVGGPNLSARDAGLRISQRRNGGGYGPANYVFTENQVQTLTLTFSAPVQNLRFALKDLDGEAGGHAEQALVESPNGVTIVPGAHVALDAGGSGSPFYYTTTVANVPVADEAYWLSCTVPGTVSQVTVKYFTCTPGGGGVLGNLTFEADVPCSCEGDGGWG